MRTSRFRFQRVDAFTLVELLAVIAIIALLSALLLPFYSKIIGTANRAACVSNLRNIGIAVTTYMADNDGYYPGPINASQGIHASGGALSYVLRSYAGAPDLQIRQLAPSIFRCPAWKKLHPNVQYADGQVVYMTNHLIAVGPGPSELSYYDPWGTSGKSAPIRQITLASLEGQPDFSWSPAKTEHGLFSLSGTWAITDLDYPFVSLPYMNGGTWSPRPDLKPVHGEVRNVLFFDWHVESVSARFAADGQLVLNIPR
ncbi:MAG: prepilin-type N-terminal cleavage/methylation domain-containing protein [Terrimicrobiaceae bacterium]